ncbi:MAG: polysaccharide deacetylase family protein [Bacteroidetes bacterium]|nr:MAG: polysaccharide deacetylase family protein [Bacteroidota bacterium]
MKLELYKKINWLFTQFSIDFYTFITQQKRVLPFYHSITNHPKPHLKHLGFYRTKNAFKDDIAFFNKHFNSVNVEQLQSANNLKNEFHISFDDGLSEIFSEAMPTLIKNNTHATVFINSDFIDNKNMFIRHKISLLIDVISNYTTDLLKLETYFSCEKHLVSKHLNQLKNEKQVNEIAKLLTVDFDLYLLENKPYLTTNQLLELKKMGFTIGNHSKNHPNFNTISFDQQQIQLNTTHEFLKSNQLMDSHYFSFPYGDENIENKFFNYMYNQKNVVQSFGVSGLKKDEHPQHLHRIPMEYNNLSAEQILKFEYFYFIIKSLINKNKVKR